MAELWLFMAKTVSRLAKEQWHGVRFNYREKNRKGDGLKRAVMAGFEPAVCREGFTAILGFSSDKNRVPRG